MAFLLSRRKTNGAIQKNTHHNFDILPYSVYNLGTSGMRIRTVTGIASDSDPHRDHYGDSAENTIMVHSCVHNSQKVRRFHVSKQKRDQRKCRKNIYFHPDVHFHSALFGFSADIELFSERKDRDKSVLSSGLFSYRYFYRRHRRNGFPWNAFEYSSEKTKPMDSIFGECTDVSYDTLPYLAA